MHVTTKWDFSMKLCIFILAIMFFCSCQVNPVAEKPTAQQSNLRRIPVMRKDFLEDYGKVMEILRPAGSAQDVDITSLRTASNMLLEMQADCKDSCNAGEFLSIYNSLAWIYLVQDDKVNALKYYDLVLQLSPQIPLQTELRVLGTVSDLYTSLGDYEKASYALDRMEELDARTMRANCTPRVDILVLNKEYPAALQKIQQCISEAENTRPLQLARSDSYKTQLELMDTLGHEENRAQIEEKYQLALEAENEFTPIVVAAPIYPKKAITKRIEGYCTVEFTVTKEGNTENITALDCPNDIFLAESIKAASKFKYKPQSVNGLPVDVEQVNYRFVFEIKGG